MVIYLLSIRAKYMDKSYIQQYCSTPAEVRYLSFYLSIYLSIYLSFFLSIYLFINLFIYLSICLSTYCFHSFDILLQSLFHSFFYFFIHSFIPLFMHSYIPSIIHSFNSLLFLFLHFSLIYSFFL